MKKKIRQINNNFLVKNKISWIGIAPFLALFLIAELDDTFWGLNPYGITAVYGFFKILLIQMASVVLFILLLKKYRKNIFQNLPGRNLIFYGTLLFIFLFQYAVSFFTPEVSLDLDQMIATFVFLIIFSFLFNYSLKSLEDLKNGSYILLTLFIIVTLQVFYEFYKVEFAFSGFRPGVTFANPTYMACFFIALLPFTYVLLFQKYESSFKSIFNKRFFILLFLMIFATLPLLFSQSRAAWLGFFISMFLLFLPFLFIIVFQLNFKKGLLVYLFFIFISIVLPILLLNLPIPIFQNILVRISETVQNPLFEMYSRITGWAGGISLFKKYPLFGAGLSSVNAASFDYIDKYFLIYVDRKIYSHSHNEYIELLGEGGIFSLLLFLSLNAYVLQSLIKIFINSRKNIQVRLYSLAVMSGIVAVLVEEIFSISLRVAVSMSAYYSLLAIGLFLISHEKSFQSRFMKIKRNITFIVITLLLLVNSARFFPLLYVQRVSWKGINSINSNDGVNYLNKAVEIRPQYYNTHLIKWKYYTLRLLFEDSAGNRINKKALDEIEKSLISLEKIHPQIYNLNQKFAVYYFEKSRYFIQQQNEISAMIAFESLDKCLDYLNKAIDYDYLFLTNVTHHDNFKYLFDHSRRIFVTSLINKNENLENFVKEYIQASILFKFCSKNSIFKENVIVDFKNATDYPCIFDKKQSKYHFHVSKNLTLKIANEIIEKQIIAEKQFNGDIIVPLEKTIDLIVKDAETRYLIKR